MTKFDHMALAVQDFSRSRDWYRANLGLRIEFEVPERRTAAMQDDAEFTIFLQESDGSVSAETCVLYFQVADVAAKYAELSSRGIAFVHPPRKEYWGYGAELRDPDGYRLRLWDHKTMREHGDQ